MSAWRFMLKALYARGRAMFRQPSSIGLPKLRQSGGVPFLAPIALLGAALLAVPASGQEWAEKMFSVTCPLHSTPGVVVKFNGT